VPEGQTINQVYYKVLTTLHERVRKKDLKCGRTAHVLHHDNTLSVDISGEAQAPRMTFFISRDQVCIKRNPF
jgi:hypothetical protein